MKRYLKPLSLAATIGMFIVLVMGATVTNTGSEHGCGRSWPLCHGQLIPQFAVSTFIEFSHRAMVGVESILILALAATTFLVYRQRREVRILVPLMVVFLFLQAGLGAWAVMYPQLSPVLALHFGVSLIAFASVLLTAVFLFTVDGDDILRDWRPPVWFRRGVWSVTVFSYVVVYLGAYVRHTNSDDACSGWPLCNGSVIPTLHGDVAIAFAHRLVALILVAGIVWLVYSTYTFRTQRPDLYKSSLLALAAVILQAGAGAVVVFTHLDLFSALAHAALAGLTFGALTTLCMQSLPRPVSIAMESPVTAFGRPRTEGVQAQ
jgi:cytochrome c oxidase assembly protein subunit 15